MFRLENGYSQESFFAVYNKILRGKAFMFRLENGYSQESFFVVYL